MSFAANHPLRAPAFRYRAHGDVAIGDHTDQRIIFADGQRPSIYLSAAWRRDMPGWRYERRES
jgi:hypothetical protein